MKKSGCANQAVTIVVTLLILQFGIAAWRAAALWMGDHGVPKAVLPLLGLTFGLCLFSAIMKGAVAAGMVKSLRFLPCDLAGASNGRPASQSHNRAPLPEAINVEAPGSGSTSSGVPLDLAEWERASREIESLGFERIMDFTAEGDRPLPPGFARLFVSPQHGARAELNQIFPTSVLAKPTKLTCVFTSVLAKAEDEHLQNRWTLETSNSHGHSGSGVTWAMRRPRALWSRHPNWSPAQLLTLHLERRAAMQRDLGLTERTGLSWESYCQSSVRSLQEQRKRLLSRPGLYIWWCNSFEKNHRYWWGDDRSAPPPPL